jgi:hypothetical protein
VYHALPLSAIIIPYFFSLAATLDGRVQILIFECGGEFRLSAWNQNVRDSIRCAVIPQEDPVRITPATIARHSLFVVTAPV